MFGLGGPGGHGFGGGRGPGGGHGPGHGPGPGPMGMGGFGAGRGYGMGTGPIPFAGQGAYSPQATKNGPLNFGYTKPTSGLAASATYDDVVRHTRLEINFERTPDGEIVYLKNNNSSKKPGLTNTATSFFC